MNRIGIDLGGTKIEGILLNEAGTVLKRKRIPTRREDGYAAVVDRIVALVKRLQSETKEPCTIGICTPGAISPKTGRIKNSNTLCLIGKPLKDDLESVLGQPIAMDNDANCFAIAEATLGAGRGYEVIFGVIMGTGVGGGIVFNKHVHRGRMYIAGEWGHHKLHPGGNDCYCGQKGCVETYISGPALERQWQALTGRSETLKEITSRIERQPSDLAGRWKTEFLNNFGLALSNVIDILDPDVIVLGGGVSNIPFLYDEGVQYVYQYVFSDIVDTPIVQNQLGDSAGVFGAALLETKP
ncbi:MAG: ROK family protein [FCB group bacterium]|nr:ROK family protein [FCB group bacterium]